MSIVQLELGRKRDSAISLFDMGFRPFFLGGMVFAILSITLWMAMYAFQVLIPVSPMLPSQWHSHEMIYGYTMAIIAGFLLTAIVNWTGVQTIQGRGLATLLILWLIPRILFFFGSSFLYVAAAFDLLFMLSLLAVICRPIIQTKSWKQLGIISKVVLLTVGNLVFYLGALGYLDNGMYLGIYGGLYLIIALILTIGSRVMPAFITNGVGYKIEVRNPKWIMILSLVLFVGFFYSELFAHNDSLTAIFSIGLLIINSYRLTLWHTVGIWKKPLLWSLYLSFWSISLGFLLFALSYYYGISKFVAIHAFAVGGIGLATMGMIARVSLGHTGRNILNPPRLTGIALGCIVLAVIFRVFLPLIIKDGYLFWIFVAQVLWILGFVILTIRYSTMLIGLRVDGKFQFAKFLNLNSCLLVLSIILASFFCYYNLGAEDFSEDDQTIHSLVVQNMAHTGNLLKPTVVNKPYLNKPPLKMWIASFVIRIFGESNFNYKVLDATLGVALVAAVYLLSNLLFGNPVLSFLTILNLLSCKLFLFYHGPRVATQDTAMVFFYVLSLFPLLFIIKNLQRVETDANIPKAIFYIGLFSSLGMLCKGLGAMIIGPVMLGMVLLVSNPVALFLKFYKHIVALIFIIFLPLLVVASLYAGSWYDFLRRLFYFEGLKRVYSGYHNVDNIWYYYDILFTRQLTVAPILLLTGLVVCSYKWIKGKRYEYGFVLILALVPILFYQLIKSKLPWYIFSAQPALSIICSIAILWLLEHVSAKSKWISAKKALYSCILIFGLCSIGHKLYKNYSLVVEIPKKYPLSVLAHELEKSNSDPSIGVFQMRKFAKNDQLYLRMINSDFTVLGSQFKLEDLHEKPIKDLVVAPFLNLPKLTNFLKPKGYLLMPVYRSRHKPVVALWYKESAEIPRTMKSWCTKINLASKQLTLNKGWNENSGIINGVSFRASVGDFSTVLVKGDGLLSYYPTLIKLNLAATKEGAAREQNIISLSVNDREAIKVINPKEGFNTYAGQLPSNSFQDGTNIISIRHSEINGSEKGQLSTSERSFISNIEICPE